MKKIVFVWTLLLAGVLLSNATVFANGKEREATSFQEAKGVIVDLSDDGQMTVENDDKLITIFPLADDVPIYTNSGKKLRYEDLEKGMEVAAYYDKQMPIIMIYPATIPPEFVIVYDEHEVGQVKVGYFDENFLSLDRTLQLNIGENTEIIDKDGKQLTKDQLSGREFIVFYTVAAESFPVQTAPELIIALENKMIPLRKTAEQLGFQVKWDEKTGAVELMRKDLQITIHILDKKVLDNKRNITFEDNVELIDGKTYVPHNFFEKLLH